MSFDNLGNEELHGSNSSSDSSSSTSSIGVNLSIEKHHQCQGFLFSVLKFVKPLKFQSRGFF